MDPFIIEGHGLLLDPSTKPADARAAAAEWLTANGADEWDAVIATDAARIDRAWWAGDEVGFVQQSYPDAQAVIVVHLPAELTRSVVRKDTVLAKDRPNPFTAEPGDTDKIAHPRPTARFGDDGRIQLGPSVA